MIKQIVKCVKAILFTPADEKEDVTSSFSHKRPAPDSDRPPVREVHNLKVGENK